MTDDSPIRDTAKMSVDLTPEGLRVEFAASGGAIVRLRLNSFTEALTLVRNLLHAITQRWPNEGAGLGGGR